MAATYPADTFQEGVDLTIEASNQLAQVVRGDANTEVTVADGSTIPSIRKAQTDSMYFKEPEAWTTGQTETDYLQLKRYIDSTTGKESWWFAKGAMVSNPVAMGTSPFGDDNWTLYTPEDLFISGKAEYESVYHALKGKAAEAGYNLVNGSFEEGGALTDTNDVLWYQSNGRYYSWAGTFPKVVAAGATPATSGGIGAGAWVDRTDVTLRSELTANSSAIEEISKIKPTERLSQLRFSDFGSLSALQSYITTNSMSSVEIIFDAPLSLTTNNGNLITLSNLDYLKITSLIINDTTTYTTAFDVCRVFDLYNIKHVDIDVVATSTLSDVNGDKQGLCVVRLNGCDVFEIKGTTSGCYQLHELTNVKVIKNHSVNSDTRYPCHLYNGNGVVDIKMKNTGCRRDFFIINGVSGGTVDIDSTDQGDASQVKHYADATYTAPYSSDLKIKFKHRSTGLYDSVRPARWSPILIDTNIDSTATGVVTGSSFKNIEIEYDVVGDKFGSIIAFRKLIDDSTGDFTGRGYLLENISIKGHIELNSSSTSYFFNYNGGDNWQSSDRVRNVRLTDLRVSGSAAPVFNPNQLKLAIDTSCPLRLVNVNAVTSVITDATTDYTDHVICENTILSTHTTVKSDKNNLATLKSSGKVIKSAGSSTVQIATVENYRSICGVRINMRAYSGATDATQIAVGNFNGIIKFASTTPGSWLGAYESKYTQGTSVTPSITLGTGGEVYISLPEWNAIQAYVSFEMEIQYNQYSTNAQCSTIRGLVSKRYTILTA